jgi:S-adenosylmethionine-diacylglycerol 3-amino-3-carboxypropyl transferase
MGNQLLKDAAVNHKLASKRGILERMFTLMFQGFVYNQIWEDPDVDMAAMKIEPHNTIVTIASGGCNVVNYLEADPKRVIAVDLNPNHIALTRLKVAALQHLPTYTDFFQFFGMANAKQNAELYDTFLLERLDEVSRKYWEKRIPLRGRRINMFARNLYRYGLLGRFIGLLHGVARIQGKQLKSILEAKTPEEQRRIFDKEIGPLFDSKFVKVLSKLPVSFYALGIPPAQFEELKKDSNGNPADLLRKRIEKLACDFPINENYFAWQAFGRRYDTEAKEAVPGYLREETYKIIRERAGRVETHLASMTDFLAEQPEKSIDRFVLLDAQDWMNAEQITALWREITRSAAPGARVIFRTAGSESPLERKVPADVMGHWRYEPLEAQKGLARDRSSIYGGFHVYELQTASALRDQAA